MTSNSPFRQFVNREWQGDLLDAFPLSVLHENEDEDEKEREREREREREK